MNFQDLRFSTENRDAIPPMRVIYVNMPDQVSVAVSLRPKSFAKIGQFAKAVVQIVKSQSILGIEDHQIGEYCPKLNAIAEARTAKIQKV